jgi:hypothetical protein
MRVDLLSLLHAPVLYQLHQQKCICTSVRSSGSSTRVYAMLQSSITYVESTHECEWLTTNSTMWRLGNDNRCLSRVIPCLAPEMQPKLKELALTEILELLAPNDGQRNMEQNPFSDDIVEMGILQLLQLILCNTAPSSEDDTSRLYGNSSASMSLNGSAESAETLASVRLLACRVIAVIAEGILDKRSCTHLANADTDACWRVDPQHTAEFSKINILPTLVAQLQAQLDAAAAAATGGTLCEETQFEILRTFVALADSGMTHLGATLGATATTHTQALRTVATADELKLALFGNGIGLLLAQILQAHQTSPNHKVVSPAVALAHELAKSMTLLLFLSVVVVLVVAVVVVDIDCSSRS